MTFDVLPDPSAGSAVAELLFSSSSGTVGFNHWSGSWKAYRAKATPSDGWSFHYFELDIHSERVYATPDGDRREERDDTVQFADNPPWCDYDPTVIVMDEGVTEYDFTITDEVGQRGLKSAKRIITGSRVYFVNRRGKIVVTTSVRPAAATMDMVTALVEGSNRADRTGVPGEDEKFTLTAQAAEGWAFRRWEREGLVVGKSAEMEVSLTFPAAGAELEVEYVARFVRITGEILCNSSGTILNGASGAVLHKG